MPRLQGKSLTVVVLLGLMGGMAGLVVAAVPLYNLFCSVTGYGGTTKVAEAGAAGVDERVVLVRFDTTVHSRLPWRFEPPEEPVPVRLGENGLAYFTAENLSDRAITGRATYNVVPVKVARYFNKIECFCFTEQTLAPGQRVDMPVTFFVDPALAEDDNAEEVKTITLSYTFFRAGQDLGAANQNNREERERQERS